MASGVNTRYGEVGGVRSQARFGTRPGRFPKSRLEKRWPPAGTATGRPPPERPGMWLPLHLSLPQGPGAREETMDCGAEPLPSRLLNGTMGPRVVVRNKVPCTKAPGTWWGWAASGASAPGVGTFTQHPSLLQSAPSTPKSEAASCWPESGVGSSDP